ncbi:MAG: 3-isopropylmalate dehydratase small subunit [Proteobacteria bacterium]|nr:3-isopropylmalate dehydratase small subunit [Pseudomonadota bacterium]MBU2568228.1 3-isopropylmalate dehydratase small subunit [Elusimicrobiota bacterium]
MKISGRVIKYGDDINTDVIIPARYLNTSDPDKLASHCMEDLDAGFVKTVKTNGILCAGKNFGCGSSREHAPLSIKHAGVSCIIAESFARIFFRNAINIGLPIIEAAEASRDAETNDTIEIDLSSGRIKNVTKGRGYGFVPWTEFILGIISSGGLVEYTKNKMKGK